MSPYLGRETTRDLAHRREHGQPTARVAYGLHGEGDTPGPEQGPHQPRIYREREEGEKDQTLPQVFVLLLHRPVDLDDELRVPVDAPGLLYDPRTGLLVHLVREARGVAGTGLDQNPVPGASELVDGVRGEGHPALARCQLPWH